MDNRMFTHADYETIDIIDKAIEELRKLGATIVDPGAEGALFQECIDQYITRNLNATFIKQFPELFPVGSDQVATLVDLYADPSRVPHKLTIRDFGKTGQALGESKYYYDRYLRKRGDAN